MRKNKKSFKNSAIALISAIAVLSVVAPSFSTSAVDEQKLAPFAQEQKKWQSS